MEHTKGPLEARKGDVLNADRTWGVVKLLSREACIEIDGDDSGYGSRTEVVAEIFYAPNGQDEADARLFASAPDLLAAAKAAYRELGGDDADRFGHADVATALRAAIAAAEGGEA